MITKSAYDFKIGAEVRCQDGKCGELLKVVANPETGEITDLIVQKGLLLKEDRVIPMDKVLETSEDEIQLDIPADQLEDFKRYRKYAYRVLKPEQGEFSSFQKGQVMMHTPLGAPYGSLTGMVIPMFRHVVHEGIPEKETVVEQGTLVSNQDKQLGRVSHTLVDTETGRLQSLVVDRGMLEGAVIVSRDDVREINAEEITVNLSEEEFNEQPRFRPPSDSDLQSSLEKTLEEATQDFRRVQSAVRDGVVELSGVVSDIGGKRQVEASARGLPGVIEVENKLDTDTAITARVTAALADHPETELSDITVASERGIVTLNGRVDSGSIRQKAEKIASDQQGVIKVINKLVVEEDDKTAVLKTGTVSPMISS